MYDPDLPGEDLDLDLLPFEDRDAVEAAQAEDFRALVYDVPARPGTKR